MVTTAHQKEALDTLRELAYQGVMRIELENRLNPRVHQHFPDSKEVRDFAEGHVEPFTIPMPKQDIISLKMDGTKTQKLHEKEQNMKKDKN